MLHDGDPSGWPVMVHGAAATTLGYPSKLAVSLERTWVDGE